MGRWEMEESAEEQKSWHFCGLSHLLAVVHGDVGLLVQNVVEARSPLSGSQPGGKGAVVHHEGDAPGVFIQQWDGKKWKLISDFIPAMSDVVRPMVEKAAAAYAKENKITPRSC